MNDRPVASTETSHSSESRLNTADTHDTTSARQATDLPQPSAQIATTPGGQRPQLRQRNTTPVAPPTSQSNPPWRCPPSPRAECWPLTDSHAHGQSFECVKLCVSEDNESTDKNTEQQSQQSILARLTDQNPCVSVSTD